MAQEVFKRYEKKYMLTRDQYNHLISLLVTKMSADEYGRHTICNVYYDTPDYQLIRTSLDKTIYKEKIRLRSYGVLTEENTVFLELKKKYNGVVYKRRVPMTLKEAGNYLNYGIRLKKDSLPVIVQVVIMLVNGNLGTGVAVMGAFSLVRFRSAPGTSREISSIFLAMAMGLAVGMGNLGVAAFLLFVVGCVTIIMIEFSSKKGTAAERELKVTIPENLDYQGIFDDLFGTYTRHAQMMRVRTVNMGSLYELLYHIELTDEAKEKEFLDQVRCRNGNLGLVCGRIPTGKDELLGNCETH